MKREEVIHRFCKLSSEVREYLSTEPAESLAADCFCEGQVKYHPFLGDMAQYYQFDPQVIEFIEHAVTQRMKLKAP